jgi:hypothetical protein
LSNDAQTLQQDITRLTDEISANLDKLREVAQYKDAVVHLTLLLDAIVSQTEMRDGALYVRSAGAWRRLPDGIEAAINDAKRYLGLVA